MSMLASGRPWRLQAVGIALLVFVSDQASKWWAARALSDSDATGLAGWWRGVEHPAASRAIVVSDTFWRFRYVENSGALFGMGAEQGPSVRGVFFSALAVLALWALWRVCRAARQHPTLRWTPPLVAGGALGNYFDRVRLGYVIDFIDWHVGTAFFWPVFNVADVALVVGVAVLSGWYMRGVCRGELSLAGTERTKAAATPCQDRLDT